jgi:Histidine kinase-, DNA gyrase B-, and HSP90-like ATPase
MKAPILLDATPSKDIYRSMIADYSLQSGLCELIDNSVDVWSRGNRENRLLVSLIVDVEQQSVIVEDNAGGVGREDLVYLVKPGSSSISDAAASIGVFGVGCKRGPIALAQRTDLYTHKPGRDCFRIAYDDDWVNSDEWAISASISDLNYEGKTRIELSKLRAPVDVEAIERLKEHLSRTYGQFIVEDKVTILVNGEAIAAEIFVQWAYPEGFEPREQELLFTTDQGEIVVIKMTAGLRCSREPEDEYGVYFYCNKRLVEASVRSHEAGFFRGGAGKPHFDVSLVRATVEFHGPAKEMPWNSSKTGINYAHKAFRYIESWLHNSLKKYAGVSRAFKADWDTDVFPYTSGAVVKGEPLFDTRPVRTFTLAQHSKKTYEQQMEEENSGLSKTKPWTRGLYEGVVAVHLIAKSHLFEKWRIALIVLDSTLEIGFKDFLVNETKTSLSDRRLIEIFADRKQVVDEVLRHRQDLLSDQERQTLDYYYRLRCKLVHERSSAGINADDVANHRHLIQRILRTLFDVRFVDFAER